MEENKAIKLSSTGKQRNNAFLGKHCNKINKMMINNAVKMYFLLSFTFKVLNYSKYQR
jgi:hypothetical protein